MESPNRNLAKILMLVNLPLSIIGALGFLYEAFLLLANPKQFSEIGPGIALIGCGLWLEYAYYRISIEDFDKVTERLRWKLSIGYNIIPFLCLIIAIVINGFKDFEPIACSFLIYPGVVLALSVKALRNLKSVEVNTTPSEP